MPNRVRRSPREIWQYTAQRFNRTMLGGAWGLSLPLKTQMNLRWFWFDGLFAAASDNLYATYAAVYILALGASRAQIGLMSSLSSLASALLLLPGAMLVERIGHRREITLASGGSIARLMFLFLAVLPLIWLDPNIAVIAIVLAVVRDAFANLGYPAWTSMTGDIVPAEGRGRYLGSRFTVMGFASIATTVIMGAVISRMGSPDGFQIAMMAAFGLGLISTFCFAQIHDPNSAPPKTTNPLTLRGLIGTLRAQHVFVSLCATLFVWNFALMVAGPFFTVYHVEELHASAAMVGIVSVSQSLATMLAQRYWGELTDRWGARRVQLLTMFLIPILPILWTIVTAAWHIIFVNAIAGITWSGYNLAAFSFLLHIAPPSERARYSAIYQLVVMTAMGAGAAFGSLMITGWGYHGVFIASSIGRLTAAFLFAWLLRRHEHQDNHSHTDDRHD